MKKNGRRDDAPRIYRLPTETVDRLQALKLVTRVSANEHVRRAVKKYLEAQPEPVQRAVEAILLNAGRTTPADHPFEL